jgi:hypothetical protein
MAVISSIAKRSRSTPTSPMPLVSWLEDLIGTRRRELDSRWRSLTSYYQAVMTLVWFTKGDTFAQLGAHFGVATDTEYGEAQPVCSTQGFNEEIGGGGTGRHAKFSTRDSCHGLRCGG